MNVFGDLEPPVFAGGVRALEVSGEDADTTDLGAAAEDDVITDGTGGVIDSRGVPTDARTSVAPLIVVS